MIIPCYSALPATQHWTPPPHPEYCSICTTEHGRAFRGVVWAVVMSDPVPGSLDMTMVP